MFYRHFFENKNGRDFVIGDLHGMYDLLMQSLDAVSFDRSKDRCFSCGDLIDRGPDSEKCLSLMNEPWFFSVRGNHEQCMIDTVRHPSSREVAQWVLCGGRWHLKVSSEKMNRYADKASEQPVLMSVDLAGGRKVAICHGDYPLSVWAPDQIESDPDLVWAVLWSRTRIQTGDDSLVEGIDHIFCGHTIVDQPVILGNTHYIDTGGFESNCLTLLPFSDLS
nr:metallophosphoesterase [Endozoicomonas sp.]